MHVPIPFTKAKSHEDLFLEHYEWLEQWAVQLCQGRREDASDLVHDCYLQLVQSRPALDPENSDRIRGYLYTMLRNISVSNGRRASRDALSSLSIADFDCLEFGIAALDRSQLIFVRSDLARVCEYACRRRHTSRAASVLMLRFFLGYYPDEIRRILQTSRGAVEKYLQAARQEARAYLRKPGSLRFLGRDVPPAPWSAARLPDSPAELFEELRRRLLADTVGFCPDEGVFEVRYAKPESELKAPDLAHIVTCARCLDRINLVLGLPPLSERMPSDGIDRDRDPGEGPPSGSTRSGPDLKKLKHRLRQTYEHKPHRLQIAVNGEVRAGHGVSSALNELDVKLDPLVPPSFLEVFSEQGVRLLYLQIEETVPPEPGQHLASAELSDGRLVELELAVVRGTALASATYLDPGFDGSPIGSPETQEPPAESNRVSISSRLRPHLHSALAAATRPLRDLSSRFDFLVPLSVTVGTAIVVLCLVRLALTGPGSVSVRRVFAETLLTKSRSAEASRLAGGRAAHALFSLETFSSTGKLLDTQTVERWASITPNRAALRLLNREGRLTAGRWRRGNAVTLFAQNEGLHGGAPQVPARATFDTAWELAPGAQALSTWQEIQGSSQVLDNPAGYEIRYQRPPRETPGVIEASLVLDGSSLEPICEDVTVREASETREYRFRRLSYDVVPQDLIRDSDFALPPDLTSSSAASATHTASPRNGKLMLDALGVLARLDPRMADFVDLDRSPDGGVSVNGVLPTDEQRDAVEKLFVPLRQEGTLLIALHSNQEGPVSGQINGKPVQVESTAPIPVENANFPLYMELRATLSSRGVGPSELDARIDQLAKAALADVKAAHREAWDVEQITTKDFSVQELQQFRAEDKLRWLLLLHQHTQRLDQRLERLSSDLPLLTGPPSSADPPIQDPAPLLNSTAGLGTVAAELLTECGRMDDLLTAGLTLSASPGTPVPDVGGASALLATIRARERTLTATLEALSGAAPSAR